MSAFPRGQIGMANPVTSLKEATQLGRGASRKGLPPGMKLGEDFPMVCENCLGDNPFLRMIKLPNDAACKITHKPFNVFRWRPGKGRPYKQTIVCYDIAAEKNICQSCLVDMEYGLPVALRDAFLNAQKSKYMDGVNETPISEVNQAYYFQQKLANADGGNASNRTQSNKLLKVAREFQENQEESDVIVEGEIDPRTGKLKRKKRSILPPKDKSITTLFLSSLPEEIDEEETKAIMAPYGEVISVYMLREKLSAFVEFSSRKEAERAIFNVKGRVIVKGKKVRVGWAEKRVDEKGAPILPTKEQLMQQEEEEEERENARKKQKLEQEQRNQNQPLPSAVVSKLPPMPPPTSAPPGAATQGKPAQQKNAFDTKKLKMNLPPPPANLRKYAQTMLPPPGMMRVGRIPRLQLLYPSMSKEALEGIEIVVRDR